jgi:hypothetical protein
MRLGLYGPCKDILNASVETGMDGHPLSPLAEMGLKAAAGIMSGAFAAGITSPTELLKTRLQAKSCEPPQGTLDIVRQVMKQSGVVGLWRGAVPSMVSWACAPLQSC